MNDVQLAGFACRLSEVVGHWKSVAIVVLAVPVEPSLVVADVILAVPLVA
jgi:hypothetical protein